MTAKSEVLDTIKARKEAKPIEAPAALCPYCKTNPAIREGWPCAECRDEIESEINTAEAQQIIRRLNHRYRHTAESRW